MSNALSLPRKKKLIELPEDTLKRLSFMAVSEGKSLKAFIENLLITEAKTMNDEDLYRHLLRLARKVRFICRTKRKRILRNH